MGVPQTTTPNPTLLSTHDVRKPDANPVVGGPYMQGYDPTVAKTADGSRTNWLALPGLHVPATVSNSFTPSGTILQEASTGDQPGLAYSQVTEDHLE